MNTGHPIIAEGQHPDGSWSQNPPPGYQTIRFSINNKPLELRGRLELLIEDVWAPATFHGLANSSHYVHLSFKLGHHDEPIEYIIAPVAARFRIP